MANLARHLQSKGIRLVDPKEVQAAEPTEPQEEHQQESLVQPQTPKKVDFKMPAKKTTPTTAATLSEAFADVSVSDHIQAISGTLGYSFVSGRWEEYDHVNRQLVGHAMMRMLIDNGTKIDDIDLAWLDNKTIVLKKKWPRFMMQALTMTGLDVEDNNGVTIEHYPASHQVYVDMGKNSAALTEADGNIRSVGVFKFRKPMNTAPDAMKLKIFQVSSVTILQIVFKEEVQERKVFGSPAGIITTGTINMSTYTRAALTPRRIAAAPARTSEPSATVPPSRNDFALPPLPPSPPMDIAEDQASATAPAPAPAPGSSPMRVAARGLAKRTRAAAQAAVARAAGVANALSTPQRSKRHKHI